MAARIDYIFEPDPIEFQMAFYEVADALRDARAPLTFAAHQARVEIEESFKTHTAPDGTKWKPWSENYQEVAEAYPNVGILRRDQELYRAATDQGSFVINGDTLFYDTSDWPEYGAWHQEGRPGRKTKQGKPNPLPKREFVGVSAEGEAIVMSTFMGWFDRSIDLFTTKTGRVGRRHQVRGAKGRWAKAKSKMMTFKAGSRG